MITVTNKIKKQLSHLSEDDQHRIQVILNKYPNVEKKKIWFMNNEVSRIRCGKYRLIIKETEANNAELVFFGLRDMVYKRVRTCVG